MSVRKNFSLQTFLLLTLILIISPTVFGQAGVLQPTNTQIDVKSLALGEMSVQININNQFARVRVTQIFSNRTNAPLEGKYIFLLPTAAAISDFAVWDGDVRIPGVIIEKRRAEEIYEEIRRQQIDPGLLESDEATAGFSTTISPIPAYGTKRLEMEYTEILPVDGLNSYFSFPLKPSDYGAQTAGGFHLELTIESRYRIGNFNLISKQYPLTITRQEDNLVTATYDAAQINFNEDFAFNYKLNVPQSQLQFLAYRAPERISANELRDPNRANVNPDGYFEASVIYNNTNKNGAQKSARSVVLMLDTSLSMRWEKLDASIQAIDYFLHALTANDNFNLVLFNDDINTMSPEPLKATAENIDKAISFIRGSYLSGGTNIGSALKSALDVTRKMPQSDRSIVMITDGNSTLNTTSVRKLTSEFNNINKRQARLYVFGIGADTNTTLLSELVRGSDGYFTYVRETESLDYKLSTFFDKVGKPVIDDIKFASVDSDNFYQVYPDVDRISYEGSRFSFVGRYKRPGDKVAVSISGTESGQPLQVNNVVKLPELDNTYDHLPRMWARARVDALLREIALNGETTELINEIIALSKKYKFVTPYTAFLAAPRSLLRPRIIKPGDPVLRVRTDAAITSVIAVLPFGLSKELTYIKSDDIWETRFLAPVTMRDGTYNARLILTDKNGNAYQEEKSFIIDSRPPSLRADVAQKQVRAGEDLKIKVFADQDTRRINARLFGSQPVQITWNEKEQANIGLLHVPPALPAGRYQLQISAEDFAHNSTVVEMVVEVMGQ